MAINMSVWESIESLQQFVYRSGHVATLRERKQWFEPLDGPNCDFASPDAPSREGR